MEKFITEPVIEGETMISVIIPVFNVNQYIENCVEQLRRQTYQDYELVLVDDCSSDKSYDKCVELAVKYDNIKVHHNEVNKGVSYTRNKGVELSSGEYLCFIDADDIISECYLELLYKNLIQAKADISIGTICYENVLDNIYKSDKYEIWDVKQTLVEYITKARFHASACARLFKKDVVKNIVFDENLRIAEDKCYMFEAILNSNKIVFQDQPIYYYYKREDSAMNSVYDERFAGLKFVADKLYEMEKKEYPGIQDILLKEKVYSYADSIRKSLMTNSVFSKKHRKELMKLIKNTSLRSIRQYCSKREYMIILLEKYFLWLLNIRDHIYH